MTEKLQKVLARAGIGSRREIERWIEQGIVSVNNNIAKLGDRVDVATNPIIKINGQAVKVTLDQKYQTPQVLLYYKPVGEICSRYDEEGRPTVFDHLPKLDQGRWIMVGRLDFNTAGLLLFTDDGELANQLMHPSYEIEREYLVRVMGTVTPEMIQRLLDGIQLEDGIARCKRIMEQEGDLQGVNKWYRMVLTEGKNREIRRLWESQGVTVSRLLRIRFGNIHLPRQLKAGHFMMLLPQQVNALRKR